MATTFETRAGIDSDRRFFLILAIIISVLIFAGFFTQYMMGRSTFAVPWPYHVHGGVFFGWVVLFLTQTAMIARGDATVHRRLGIIAFAWMPLMVAMGFTIMIVALRRTGGPFFFHQNVFLFSNTFGLLCFAGLTFAALKVRRHMGWHSRLMICGFALLSNPGLGRLLPMPLFIPYAWHIMIAAVLIFPLVGMIRDKRRLGHVHPAWWWGVGAIVAAQATADVVAITPFGIRVTESVIAGTPGADRPMEAFLPPGFAM